MHACLHDSELGEAASADLFEDDTTKDNIFKNYSKSNVEHYARKDEVSFRRKGNAYQLELLSATTGQ